MNELEDQPISSVPATTTTPPDGGQAPLAPHLFLHAADGLAAVVDLPAALDWSAPAACQLAEHAVVIRLDRLSLSLSLPVLDLLLQADGNPAITLYPLMAESSVAAPVGRIELHREALLEARGMLRAVVTQ